MADWVTLPAVTTAQAIHVDLFQDVWTDLYNLKNPSYSEKIVTPTAAGYATASTTLANVDTTNVRLELETFGNDVLVGLTIRRNNTNSNAGGKYCFSLDGVAQGNSNGQANFQDIGLSGGDAHQLICIFHDLTAGQHTIDLQWAVGASNAGTETAFDPGATQYAYLFWAVEFP